MSKKIRIISLAIIDAVLLNLSVFVALLIKYDTAIPERYIGYLAGYALSATLLQLAIFSLYGLYRSLWEYASLEEMVQIIFATLTASAVGVIVGFVAGREFPVSIYIVGWMFLCMMVSSTRLSYRVIRRVRTERMRRRCKPSRAMIIGAGSAGSMLIRELKNHTDMNIVPVVAVDDDKKKHSTKINGVPIVSGRERIKELASQ